MRPNTMHPAAVEDRLEKIAAFDLRWRDFDT